MATFRTRPAAARAAATALLLARTVRAHGGHGAVPDGQVISAAPMDGTLWVHILIQCVAWGILYPTGMVLGLVRSRWHVPVQVAATAMAIPGYFLGHAHKGRQFGPNAHARFANVVMLATIVQVGVGVYLRMHLDRGFLAVLRRPLVRAHGVLGGMLPVAIWAQFLLGGIASQGFCQGDHLGQCLAHFIMGSAFVAYGIVLTLMLLNGQAFLARTGRSQEFYDSSVIALWGCVNTFTEHRWGQPWAKNDLQHTSMGIVWWAAGLVGIWLSRDRHARPRRNLIPALVIIFTGWAMSAHPQDVMLSTHVHTIFGYTLMSAGGARMIEIAFVLKDRNTLVGPEGGDVDAEINSFQYLTPFFLCASGFLFMGATEEQMKVLSAAGVTHVSYILILYTISFLLFLFVLLLLRLYSAHSPPSTTHGARAVKLGDEEAPRANGHARIPHAADTPAPDAQGFELEALMSDDDDDEPDEPDAAAKAQGRPTRRY